LSPEERDALVGQLNVEMRMLIGAGGKVGVVVEQQDAGRGECPECYFTGCLTDWNFNHH